MNASWGRGVVTFIAIFMAAAGCGATETGSPAPAPEPVAPPVPHATGVLDSWDTLTPMPTPRGNHCSVVANDHLVVIGGNYKPKGAADFVTIADVHVARIAADGSIGEWKLAGKAPSPVNSCTAAADGKDIYLVDGIFTDEAAGAKAGAVRRATLSDSGDLGAWQDLGALPEGVRVLYSSAYVANGALRAFHAKLPDSGDGVALVGAPVAGAALGTWQETTWLTGFRGHPQYAFATIGTASYVYALGGYATGATTVLSDGAGASLDAAGVPGKSFKVGALPKPTSSGQAIAIDDWMFLVGGKDEVLTGKGRPDAYAAKIAADGSLEAWATVGKLPQGRTSHALAGHGDFIYVTGGGYDAGGLDTVFGARVRFTK